MIKHIVMFRLRENFEGEERQSTLLELKKRLEALPSSIESIKFFRIGMNFNDSPSAYDLVIDSDFNDKEGLNKYQVHPEHQKVVAFLRNLDTEKAVVDYEY